MFRRNFLKWMGLGALGTAAKVANNVTPTMPVSVEEPVESVEIFPLGQESYCIPGKLHSSGTVPGLSNIVEGSGRISESWAPRLKPGQVCSIADDISWYCVEPIERGTVVSANSDYLLQVVQKQDKNKPVLGILLQDVVNINRQWPPELSVATGGKVTILRKGTVLAHVDGDVRQGSPIYSHDGKINATTGPWVGHAITSNDEDGYAKINIHLAD